MRVVSSTFVLLCRDPDPDERNDYFDFALVFFGTKTLYIDSQRSIISHGSELDGKIQVITNYCVVNRIQSSREVVIRIPTNVTIISTFHSLFWHEIIFIDSQCSYISHGTELDGKFQVNTNYCVAI